MDAMRHEALSTSSNRAGKSLTAPVVCGRCSPATPSSPTWRIPVSTPAPPFPVHLAQDPGIDDALIQPYSGHASRQSLEVYSRIALADAQHSYDQVIDRFPV